MNCERWIVPRVLILLILLILPVMGASLAVGQSSPPAGQGRGTFLAVEDTFSFSTDEYDTLLVAAPRVKVAEVIQAIGERIERDAYRIRSHEFTVLTTMIQRKDQDPASGNFILYETAVRQRSARGEGTQSVLLWDRERKFEDGELVEEKHEEEEFKADWHEVGQSLTMAIPFAEKENLSYRYEIEDRKIVGDNVIYKILFEPKSRFDALPSGTVWVDYSDLVLRRIEARFTGTVPYPLFLKALPFLRLTQKKLGEFWLPHEMHARIELRKMPLPDWPNNIELHTVVKDQVINGVAYNDDGTVREPGAEEEAP